MKNKKLIIIISAIGITCVLIIINLVFAKNGVSLTKNLFGTESTEMVTNQTQTDWELSVDNILTALIAQGESHLSNSIYVLNGSRAYSEELALADTTLLNTQQAESDIENLSPPNNMKDKEDEIITYLQAYESAIGKYSKGLTEKDADMIKEATDDLKNSMSSLKTAY